MASRLRLCLRDIPPLFQHAKLTDFPDQLVKLLLSRNPGQGLYLFGPVGVGKSRCLSALARHITICVRGECLLKRVIFDCLNKEVRTAKSEMKVLRPFLDCDILILDDVGVSCALGKREAVSSGRLLTTLLDWRLENRKPTFVTSNLSIESLGFDERVKSRLRTFRIIKIEGRDRRVPPEYLF
jgi:DNA replication protein DnaC